THFPADISQNRGVAFGGTGTFHGRICRLASASRTAIGEVAGRDRSVAGRQSRLQKYSLRCATRLQSRASCAGLRENQTNTGKFPRISERSETAALSTAH